MGWESYIDFVDIGGLTESTYHNIRFKKYNIIKEGNEQIIAPVIDFDFVDVDIPTAKNARDILIGLLRLYNRIKLLDETGAADAILDWCNRNMQSYNIDKLNQLFHDSGEDDSVYSKDIMALSRFSLKEFKKDLITLATHFNFYYALDMVRLDGPRIAMDLYRKYDGWSEYSCFEKYKKKALKETQEDEKSAATLFKKYIEDNMPEFMRILVNKFHSFRISLVIDPVTNKPVHHIAVDSIFDIAWFAFSKLITEDASYIELEDANYFDDFNDDEATNKTLPITRCPVCGDYFRRVKNKKYCSKPECQKQRAAIKSRNYFYRKKNEKQ